ncbi:hypothetical protein FRX31_008069 [Thalictrum thalictroides]|uniref:Uncharacterized protein n=1 Tax=Thalictrum thalictroides TaxID=46969 RepID=A0A7J6WY44_THATH|nr:hypothetical protein FRX31_008069 [Thalictrum thalictroides]
MQATEPENPLAQKKSKKKSSRANTGIIIRENVEEAYRYSHGSLPFATFHFQQKLKKPILDNISETNPFDDNDICDLTSSPLNKSKCKPAPPRSTMPMSSLAPLFSPALSVLGRNVTAADCAWRDPTIAYAMTQITILPRDEQSLKAFSDKCLKSHQFCLASCSDEVIQRLRQHRDELVKGRDRLKSIIDNNDVVSKLKRDYHKLQTEIAGHRKAQEGQIVELKVQILQAKDKVKLSEDAKQFMAVKASKAETKLHVVELDITRLKSNLETSDFEIKWLKTNL